MRRITLRVSIAFVVFAVMSIAPLYGQSEPVPPFPFAAIHDDALWLYGFAESPQRVEVPAEVLDGQALDIHGRPLVWSDDGQSLYFTLDVGTIGGDIFFPIMRTDRAGTIAEAIIPVTTYWYGADYYQGDLYFAQFNTEARYGQPEIYPYGEDQISIFAPVQHDLFVQAADGAIEAAPIGFFPQGVDCNGGPANLSQSRYHSELNWQGNPLTLIATSHGILHTFTCWGGGIALLDPQTGTDTLLGNRLRRIQLHPDGHEIIGIDDIDVGRGHDGTIQVIRRVDLTDLQSMTLPTMATPDQLAWHTPESGEIFYSAMTPIERIELTDDENAIVDEVTFLFGDGGRHQASIHRYNLETGEEAEIYSADAYAIGRMTVTPDGRYLLFSQIPNADDWVEAVLTSDDPTNDDERKRFSALLDPAIYALDLETGEVSLIAERAYFFSLNRAAYIEMEMN